jgi:hypothetical protein
MAISPYHVYSWSIVPFSEEELRGTIPECHDSIRVPVRLVLADTKGSGESKVSQFENTLLRDEHVGCFHVTVQYLIKHKKYNQFIKLTRSYFTGL